MDRNRVAFGVAVLLVSVGPALAQGDTAAMAHRSAANQLGILEYCRGKGDVGANAIDAQKSVMAHLPPSAAATDDAEASGRNGTLVLPDGSTRTVSDMTVRTNTTLAELCGKLGESALRSAAMYGSGAMPQMPGGMQMPAMPNGMKMPSMPGMPSPAPNGGS